jgi:Gpi18-like mannosyltransferase
MKHLKKIILLFLCLHLFLLNFLFVFRYSPQEALEKEKTWGKAELHESPMHYLKLYFSSRSDESYYYEWSTLVLGKNLESDYPLASLQQEAEKNEIQKYFSQNPSVIAVEAKDQSHHQKLFPLFREPPHFRMPYRDISFEYPPLLILPILTARLLSHDYASFTRALALLVSLAYFASLYVVYQIWQRFPQENRLSWPTLLFFSGFSIGSLGQIYVTRLDVFPSLLYLLALYSFIKEKYATSALWMALGTLTKVYPILLAPLFALVLIQQKKYKELITSIAWGLSLLVMINLGLGWLTEGHYWESIRFHTNRGIQIESLYASIPLLTHWIFHAPLQIYSDHNSLNINSSWVPFLLKISTLLPILLFTFIYGTFWRVLKSDPAKKKDAVLLVQSAFLLVFAFLLTFKVFSPQFLIWLTPLIFLAVPQKKKLFLGCFVLILILTQIIYPSFYFLIGMAHPLGISMLLIRNSGLIVLFIWLINSTCLPCWQGSGLLKPKVIHEF